MAFWIAAGLAALAAALWVARPLAVGRRTARSRAAHDEQVFRDQLAEVDRDMERGVLTAEEARSARIEVSRRLLAAAAERESAPDHQPAPRRASHALAVALLVAAPLGGWALYGHLGAPGLPDQPLATRDAVRPAQSVAEALIAAPAPSTPPGMEEMAALVAQLEARLAEGEADRQGLFLLARSLAQVGRFAESWRTYRTLLDRTGGDAPAQVYAAMAESMILAAMGYVSPEAERALDQALRREPTNPVARYYAGEAFAQTGKPQSAIETWAGLLADSPPDAPWIEATRERIFNLAAVSGVQPPPGLAADPQMGPDSIVAMVRGLDARLAAEGGSPEQWAQLARSYAVLSMDAEAEVARKRARAALADDPPALAAFEDALTREGTAPPVADAGPRAPGDPALPGPDAETMAAAAAMPAAERQAMIAGMVERLRERLYAEGGEVEEWGRLIQSMGVIGDAQGAADAYARAAVQHRSDAIALAFLRERALLAGARIE